MVLTMAPQQYTVTATQDQKKANAKPKVSAKFSPVAQEIWLKLRAILDHASMNQLSLPPFAVGLLVEELYEEMLIMTSDTTVYDSLECTQPLCYHVTELPMGTNVNTEMAHPLQ